MTEPRKPSLRRQKKRAARVEELTANALEIALADGIDQLTVARLAKRMDSAVGALYRYFPSKAALITAMQQRAITLLHADLVRLFDRADQRWTGSERNGARNETRNDARNDGEKADKPDPAMLLAGALFVAPAYLIAATNTPRRHRMIDAWVSNPTALLDDEQATSVNATLALILGLATGRMRTAVAAGVLAEGDNDARAHTLWALVHGLDHFRKRDRLLPASLQVPTLLRDGLGTLALGWGAHDDVVAAALDAIGQVTDDHAVWPCGPELR